MRMFVMTGDFMTGKTTWIMRMADSARDSGVEPAGVVAPAVFRGEKKTGIDALLLPGRERFPLARPRSGTFVDERAAHAGRGAAGAGEAPASHEKLGWDFDGAAMRRVNRHLAGCAGCELLIVDELGPLELLRGEGYTEALALLDASAVETALVVVRPALLDTARERWDAFEELTPGSSVEEFLAAL